MSPVVAVLGLGEAGGAISADLVAAGVTVRGYDPAVTATGGVRNCTSEADAATGADVVLSVNSSKAAVGALRAGLAGTATTTVWADLNTAAPGLKRELGEICAEAGVAFTDVSLMAPVPGKGLFTPMLVSGTGAARYGELLGAFGAKIEVLDGPAGLAATRKLLRSVVFKGTAAAIVEALLAAREAGLEDWLRAHLAEEIASWDAAMVTRFEEGSYKHAVRRAEEMRAAGDLLGELGVPSRVADASRDWLEQLITEQKPG